MMNAYCVKCSIGFKLSLQHTEIAIRAIEVKVYYPTLDMALFQLNERFKILKTYIGSSYFNHLKPENLFL